eukprot:6179513-Pleurochrysis_carterae.AAC.1
MRHSEALHKCSTVLTCSFVDGAAVAVVRVRAVTRSAVICGEGRSRAKYDTKIAMETKSQAVTTHTKPAKEDNVKRNRRIWVEVNDKCRCPLAKVARESDRRGHSKAYTRALGWHQCGAAFVTEPAAFLPPKTACVECPADDQEQPGEKSSDSICKCEPAPAALKREEDFDLRVD